MSIYLKHTHKSLFALPVRRLATKHTFYAKDLKITQVENGNLKPQKQSDYVFGKVFTDHMLTIDWDYKNGWHTPVIQPYGPISLPVTATSLHYGISAYESVSVTKN